MKFFRAFCFPPPSRHSRQLAAVVFAVFACVAGAAFLPAQGAKTPAEKPVSCAGRPALGVPEWARNAIIYEVNTTQFSKSGKLSAVTDELPRLRELGVTVLWLMPVHPIGKLHRLGPVGSCYSVRDYRAINPELGTAEDFRKFVEAAHAQGFHVLMDWVGNHSAWDNTLTKEHPDFYVRDAQGNFMQAHGWRDVIQFDFRNHAVWDYQCETMAYWVREYGVDGFRCDFANGPPTKMWDYITAKLRAARPDLFMLAEAELPQHQLKSFNASYSFGMMRAINTIAKGEAPLSRIDETLAGTQATFPKGAALMYYTSNHDVSSDKGSESERLGGGAAPFAVLTFMLDGVPLICNGQEAGLGRRVKLLQRNPIEWGEGSGGDAAFYRTLCELRKTHPALRTGAPMRRLRTTADQSLYVVLREAADKSGRRVLALLNLTASDVNGAKISDPALAGAWRNAFGAGKGKLILKSSEPLSLKAWDYRVYVSEQ